MGCSPGNRRGKTTMATTTKTLGGALRAGLDGLAFREVRFAIKGPPCNRCDRRRCLIALSFCHQLLKSGSCSRNLVALFSLFGYCLFQVGKVFLCVLA